ncbi:TonB-dependent receptor plug domain-containing protein [Qipengyuania qiaonensis]|uniref:TonB-dependent receptor n=1 Tax=Qipengyuania qiaonensis TaxID=2867240 RepID=A0ABS7J6R6_9SPHN|nr:TonB-dependent receptor [Qipengyuania qiaonensis]MBX7481680.1 TonB-dependent receptor [Qipengyuania qiaonensis]
MRIEGRTVALILSGVGLVGLSSQAAAQQADEEMVERPDIQHESGGEGDEVAVPIVVTGTRIRGAPLVGEVTSIDRETIVEAGQIDLGEAIRALPQNFAGGQNPGVGLGSGINQNINSTSAANLRGLGPDATLTLLNGHRLPYDSAYQAIDISAIPLAAVDRIEVVPDGASALYGSDAVGGVINVILRRDFDGVTTSAQIGTSTDGGNFRQQADVVAGRAWSSGGVVFAYDFVNNSAIEARQRDYTDDLIPGYTLFPSMERHALTLAAHQQISPGIEASIDALYSRRTSRFLQGTADSTGLRTPEVEAFALAPSAKIDLGAGWQVTVLSVFGRDRTDLRAVFTPQIGSVPVNRVRYFNEIFSIEGGAEGPLFALPGGSARLAVGAGIRNNRLDGGLNDAFYDFDFDAEQRARFAYGELFLPFVTGRNARPGVARLSVSAAVRYEDYPGLDEQAAPRVGLIYAPLDGLTFRASWARSFKAPTLYQRNLFSETYLVPAPWFGVGTAGETILFVSGGNPDLKPERAESWTIGFEIEPNAAPGLRLSATLYDIAYEDRVVSPISGGLASAFTNPGFASQVTLSPSETSLSELIAQSQFGLQNLTGDDFDPSSVFAILDNRETNIAAWSVRGVDLGVGWDRSLGSDQSLGIDLSGTWLDSAQRVTPTLPDVQLSGTVYNPPRYRARGSLRYQSGPLTANAAVNYTGGFTDERSVGGGTVSPSATVDLGLRYALIRSETRDPGLELALTVQNVFNDEPPIITQSAPSNVPYDSTNFSPVGRFIAFGVRRHW